MVMRAVGSYSGGEKARLVLAMLMYARPNLLLLDEPTNHLDLDMRHALTLALQDFAGALVVVAHDRHLLRTTADTLLLVNNGIAQDWLGDLDDYARWLGGGRRELPWLAPTPVATVVNPNERSNEKQRRQQNAQARTQLKPLRDAVRLAESALERAQKGRAELAAKLADPELYEPTRREQLKALLMDKARVETQIDAAESEWLTHSEALELAEQAASVG